jgi:hypothetical protein
VRTKATGDFGGPPPQSTTKRIGPGRGSRKQEKEDPIGRHGQESVVAQVDNLSPSEDPSGTGRRLAWRGTASAQNPAPVVLERGTRYALGAILLDEGCVARKVMAFPRFVGMFANKRSGEWKAGARQVWRGCRVAGRRWPTGRFFVLNLKSQRLFPLVLADLAGRKREHDVWTLKRQSVARLCQGAGKGRKVLWVWDKAGVDFPFWQERETSEIYFLSLRKVALCLKVEQEQVATSSPAPALLPLRRTLTAQIKHELIITKHSPR